MWNVALPENITLFWFICFFYFYSHQSSKHKAGKSSSLYYVFEYATKLCFYTVWRLFYHYLPARCCNHWMPTLWISGWVEEDWLLGISVPLGFSWDYVKNKLSSLQQLKRRLLEAKITQDMLELNYRLDICQAAVFILK